MSPWIYLTLGVIAMVLEIFVPGGIVMCMGLSAISIGALQLMGYFTDPSYGFMVFSIFSILLVFPMLWFLKKISPHSESSVSNIDEDLESCGKVVVVTETVMENNSSGRIRFQGSDWPATSAGGTFPKDSQVKIIGRDNLIWIVSSHQNSLSQFPPTENIHGV